MRDDDSSLELEELTISAAASLTKPLNEIKELYEEEYGVKLTINYGGSGKLAQQIQQGAPIDLFISANEEWMDTLTNEDFIVQESIVSVVSNSLVIIANKESSYKYGKLEDIDMDNVNKIAIGNPDSVPAGEYTKEVLTKLNKWGQLSDRFVYAKDVRQALTYVETGNAEIGFVYESDVINSDKVKMIAKVPPGLHGPIIYPGAITTSSKQRESGELFLQFLLSDNGQNILQKHGFLGDGYGAN